MIFPYNLITNADGCVHASLIQPEEMADRYPLCWPISLPVKTNLNGGISLVVLRVNVSGTNMVALRA